MQNVRRKLVFECAPSVWNTTDPDSQKQEVDVQETETVKRFGGLFSLPDSLEIQGVVVASPFFKMMIGGCLSTA